MLDGWRHPAHQKVETPATRGFGFHRLRSLLVTLVLLIALAPACGSDDGAARGEGNGDNRTLTVFAAASLTNAFSSIGNAFEQAHPNVTVEFNFAGSQTLATQLSEGASADLFASADTVQMERAREAGVLEGEPTIFAHNQLVVIMPIDNPANLNNVFELGNPDLKLVVAAPEVPAGAYAREVLEELGRSEPLLRRYPDFDGFNIVSNEVNVLQVVTRVRLGEADAGIVYETDVTPDVSPQVRVLSIIDDFNVRAEYPIAPVDGGDNEQASAFIDFLLSPEGQQVLAGWGFLPASR